MIWRAIFDAAWCSVLRQQRVTDYALYDAIVRDARERQCGADQYRAQRAHARTQEAHATLRRRRLMRHAARNARLMFACALERVMF